MMRHRAAWIGAVVTLVVAGTGDRPARADASMEECIAAAERGQELAKAGRLNAASEHFARCVKADCPTAVQRDCVQFAAQTEADMATLVVSVTDERGIPLKTARILVDGAGVETAYEAPIRVEPGSHVLDALTERGRASARVQLAAGERGRRVALRIHAENAPERRPTPAAVWVLGGVGVIGVAAFGVLGALGTSEVHDLRARCAPACPQSDLNAATAKLIVGDAALLTGVIALAAAAWIYFERPKAPVTTALAF